jgi:hypothetical protein
MGQRERKRGEVREKNVKCGRVWEKGEVRGERRGEWSGVRREDRDWK